MKLTGVALAQFTIKYGTIKHLPESCQNALIIEFFDSVGHIGEETIMQILINELIANRSVLESINAAIEKANEIYNET